MQYVYIGGTLVPQRPGARDGMSATKAIEAMPSTDQPKPLPDARCLVSSHDALEMSRTMLAEPGADVARSWPSSVPMLPDPGRCCPILVESGCRRWPVLVESGCRRWPSPDADVGRSSPSPGADVGWSWPGHAGQVGHLQKLCIQLKSNVCSCHRALYAICIYRGVL
jgi:hypothetical protein